MAASTIPEPLSRPFSCNELPGKRYSSFELYYAQHCREICEAEGIGDFDLAFAYEALARAYAISEQKDEAQRYLKQARGVGEQIEEEDDRDYFFEQLATLSI